MDNETLARIYSEGKQAFNNNVCITRCPYPMNKGKMTPARAAWFKGYNYEKALVK